MLRPVLRKGRFSHPWPVSSRASSPWVFLRDALDTYIRDGGVPRRDWQKLNKELPVRRLTGLGPPDSRDAIRFVWLGHASSLFQMQGATIVTDPVFSHRAGSPFGPRRYRPPPCSVEDLPNIDVVLISHNHYDHCDIESLRRLEEHSQPYYIVPLAMEEAIPAPPERVIGLSWWDTYRHSSGLNIVLTPAQHWSRRGIFDACTSLWGGFAVVGQSARVFFAGDTGFYCPLFKEIGRRLGPFDLSALPIGAYAPKEWVGDAHVDPEEAVEIHRLIQSKRSVGIHWGTFTLAAEHYLEPRERLRRAAKNEKYPFSTAAHGEVIRIPHG